MSIFDIEVATIDGQPMKMDAYRGQWLLIVNVASQCVFTGQYAGLEELYRRWKDRGFVILGFPCNQFAWQEPRQESAIKEFCSLKYNVSFPMFRKVKVNGANAHPLYQHLKAQRRGSLGTRSIKWNFTKFLVDPAGNVVKRYGPSTSPKAISDDLAAHLPPRDSASATNC
jgi:glutathione peroxidase